MLQIGYVLYVWFRKIKLFSFIILCKICRWLIPKLFQEYSMQVGSNTSNDDIKIRKLFNSDSQRKTYISVSIPKLRWCNYTAFHNHIWIYMLKLVEIQKKTRIVMKEMSLQCVSWPTKHVSKLYKPNYLEYYFACD